MPRRTPMLVCAYLGPLALIPLALAGRDADTQWHARQGLALVLVELAVFLVLSVLVGAAVLTNMGAGIALLVATWLLWSSVLALHVAAIAAAVTGQRLRVPGVSLLAELDWWRLASSLAGRVRRIVRPR